MLAAAHICLRSYVGWNCCGKHNLTGLSVTRTHLLSFLLLEKGTPINMRHHKSEHKPRYLTLDGILGRYFFLPRFVLNCMYKKPRLR